MTEPDAPNPINPNQEGGPERVLIDGRPERTRKDFLPLLYLLGFLVLAGSLFYLYRNPSMPAGVEQEAARVDTLQGQLQSLNDRLAQVEQRPVPSPPPSLAPLEARIATLEQRPVPASPPPPPDFGPITSQLDGTLSKQAADLQGVATRFDGALAKQATDLQGIGKQLDDAASKAAADLQGVATRLDGALAKQATDLQGIAKRLDDAASKETVDLQGVSARLDAMDGRLAAVEKQGGGIAGQISGITERAQRSQRVQVATAALESGQKLGDIPGAPPALAQFAHDAPPTEAGLRLSFNTAAEAAQRASQPAIMDNQPFASRLWTRAQQSVTVRQGDRVLLGDPVSGVLAHARQALDAGDLPGAIAVLNGLAGPAATAMADWVAQARSLLDARAALASMAARG